MIRLHCQFAVMALILSTASSSAIAQMSFTLDAPAHLALAEEMALCIYWQGLQDHCYEINKGQKTPYNNYGATWESMHVVWGDTINSHRGLKFLKYYKFNGVCANFVTQMLAKAYDWDWSEYTIPNEASTRSPNSHQYAQYILNNHGYLRIHDVTTVVSGDILAIDYKQDIDSGDNSGHTMIIRSYINYSNTRTNSASTVVYRLHKYGIVDCTLIPHDDVVGGSDSRRYNTGSGTSMNTVGAGVAIFYIVTNEKNKILGYLWKEPAPLYSYSVEDIMSDKKQNQSERPLYLGRLVLSDNENRAYRSP